MSFTRFTVLFLLLAMGGPSAQEKTTPTDAKRAEQWFGRGASYARKGDHQSALIDLTKAIELQPNYAAAYQARGVVNFKLARMKDCIADFDRFIALHPEQEAHHWQRGIAYYYAGEYEKGRKQFELHQTVNPNDVENAVWHFLCVAKAKSIEEARKKLIAISGDTRVPMKEVHLLFSGKGNTEEVINAAGRAATSDALFYAHLYLGLYEEACGHPKESLEHIQKAAQEYPQSHYMGDVARVHLILRQ